MRELTSHKVSGLNDRLEVRAMDEAGAGGASHVYEIAGYENDEPADRWPDGVREPFVKATVQFQNGPIEILEDMNGVSNEALLAIVEDRLLGFQSGEFACRENAVALTKLQEALMWLHKRTRDRMSRGVEGTNIK